MGIFSKIVGNSIENELSERLDEKFDGGIRPYNDELLFLRALLNDIRADNAKREQMAEKRFSDMKADSLHWRQEAIEWQNKYLSLLSKKGGV